MVRLNSESALQAGHDYVLVGRKAALSTAFSELVAEYGRATARIRTMRRKSKPDAG